MIKFNLPWIQTFLHLLKFSPKKPVIDQILKSSGLARNRLFYSFIFRRFSEFFKILKYKIIYAKVPVKESLANIECVGGGSTFKLVNLMLLFLSLFKIVASSYIRIFLSNCIRMSKIPA